MKRQSVEEDATIILKRRRQSASVQNNMKTE